MQETYKELPKQDKNLFSIDVKKAIRSQNPEYFFRASFRTGQLKKFFPELYFSYYCEQNEHHAFETVFNHLLRASSIASYRNAPFIIRCAALLHDIGKPYTYSRDHLGNVTFHKHDYIGSRITNIWMETFFTKKVAHKVAWLVQHHQFYFHEELSKKKVKKWLDKIGLYNFPYLYELRIIDRLANITKQNKPPETKEMKELKRLVFQITKENRNGNEQSL